MPVRSSRDMVQAAMERVRTVDVPQALAWHGQPNRLFVDLREPAELEREGAVPGALLAPRGVLEFWVDPASDWHRPVFAQPGLHLVLYCAIGWRSALAALALQEMGVERVCHLGGGFHAWKAAGAPVQDPTGKR